MADQLITGTTLIEDKRSEKGNIWSCPGISFVSDNPDTDQQRNSSLSGYKTADADGLSFTAPIELPNGVVIKKVIVWGNPGATAETWALVRAENNTLSTRNTMATAVIGTEDETVDFATVDNSTYRYFLNAVSLDTNDIIYGARIIYE